MADARPLAIIKELSANDTGDTGGHQAGILVPKQRRIVSFFPRLDATAKNPRHHLIFHDDDGQRWEFSFIYYNNFYFGGTRNEYRLTRMTTFIRGNGLKPGDHVILRRDPESGRRSITYRRDTRLEWTSTGALRLRSAWREIQL